MRQGTRGCNCSRTTQLPNCRGKRRGEERPLPGDGAWRGWNHANRA
jgi:hypothetical protein